jgi:serralysin
MAVRILAIITRKSSGTRPQDQVRNGILELSAQREPTEGLTQKGSPEEYSCRSGMVTSYPSFKFQYGYVQVTAKMTSGTGLWPAFWLAASNEQWPPEIDILEHWGNATNAKIYLHPLSGVRQGGLVTTPNLLTGWHTFSVYWTKSSLRWYYDGHQVAATTTAIPQQSMYFIANLAVYDATPGGCSGTLQIKSVKVWQPKS